MSILDIMKKINISVNVCYFRILGGVKESYSPM